MAAKRSAKEGPGDDALLAFFELGFLPTEGSFVASETDRWRTALYIVQQSGIEDLISTWRGEDRGDQRPGPMPWLSETQVVTLLLVLTLCRRPPLFTEMTKLIRTSPPELLALLGITREEGVSETALYHRAYNTYRRLVRLLNPEPESLYRLIPTDEYHALVAERDAEDCTKRWKRSIEFTAAMIWGTWMLLPRETRRKTTVDVVIDATHIESPGAPRSSRSPYVSSDPSCGWYKRDGNHDGSGSQASPSTSRAKTRFQRTTDVLKWAREFTFLALSIPGLPRIVVGTILDKPGQNIARNTLILIDALRERGFTIEHFIGDMAYLPGTKMEDLALPLRAREIKAVFDYPKTTTALGLQASQKGAILVEGTWYCPSMPEALVNASIDFFVRAHDDPRRITEATYRQRLEQRERYELRPKQRADKDGYRRYACPAEGRWATLKCSYKPQPPEQEKSGRTPVLLSLLVSPKPTVCQQASITVPPDVDGKWGQAYPYRSKRWQELFTSPRQTIESINRSNKRGDRTPLDDPDWRPRRGWLPTLLAGLVMILAANVRKIIAWALGDVRRIADQALPQRRERRRELSAAFTQVIRTGPPAAVA